MKGFFYVVGFGSAGPHPAPNNQTHAGYTFGIVLPIHMLLPPLSFYQIAFEPTPPLLLGILQRTLSAEEMTESAEQMLRAAQQHHCPCWLLDGRSHAQAQPPALHYWMQEEYFPRVRVALGQPPCVAFLALPRARQQPGPDAAALPEWNTPAVRMHWFTDETAAREWLRRCQPF